ncbi:hypothetical protein PybrP1_001875 [[Pythium] brassicae (nom. inval.)]|nr:hypothetical protein PybrP1_001875 [[Pythium] brassicae (nom. inval.)]
MVASPKVLAAFTVAAVAALYGGHVADATSLEYNPVTTGDTVELGHMHPAFGAWQPVAAVETRIMKDPELPDENSLKVVAPADPKLLANATTTNHDGVTYLGRSIEDPDDDDDDDDDDDATRPGKVSAGNRRHLEATNSDIKKLEAFFKTKLETNLKKLPTRGVILPTPWPSSYWPDKWGRHIDPAFRDLGPGFFHIAITNILGKFKKTFVADVTAGAQVWNQPVRGFLVKQQRRFKPKDAAKTFYATKTYPFNPRAHSIVYVKTRMSWILESLQDGPLVDTGIVDKFTTGKDYTYLLELDRSDAIIGGEWLWDSNDNHPDFLWFPTATPALTAVTSTGLSYKNVKDLVTRSSKCKP